MRLRSQTTSRLPDRSESNTNVKCNINSKTATRSKNSKRSSMPWYLKKQKRTKQSASATTIVPEAKPLIIEVAAASKVNTSLLPNELWEQVLLNLSMSDLQNCAKADPLFSSLLTYSIFDNNMFRKVPLLETWLEPKIRHSGSALVTTETPSSCAPLEVHPIMFDLCLCKQSRSHPPHFLHQSCCGLWCSTRCFTDYSDRGQILLRKALKASAAGASEFLTNPAIQVLRVDGISVMDEPPVTNGGYVTFHRYRESGITLRDLDDALSIFIDLCYLGHYSRGTQWRLSHVVQIQSVQVSIMANG